MAARPCMSDTDDKDRAFRRRAYRATPAHPSRPLKPNQGTLLDQSTLDKGDVWTTKPLNADIGVPPSEHATVLRIFGFPVDPEKYAVRLPDDITGAARWTWHMPMYLNSKSRFIAPLHPASRHWRDLRAAATAAADTGMAGSEFAAIQGRQIDNATRRLDHVQPDSLMHDDESNICESIETDAVNSRAVHLSQSVPVGPRALPQRASTSDILLTVTASDDFYEHNDIPTSARSLPQPRQFQVADPFEEPIEESSEFYSVGGKSFRAISQLFAENSQQTLDPASLFSAFAHPQTSNLEANANHRRCLRCVINKKGCDGVRPVCGRCREKGINERGCVQEPPRIRTGRWAAHRQASSLLSTPRQPLSSQSWQELPDSSRSLVPPFRGQNPFLQDNSNLQPPIVDPSDGAIVLRISSASDGVASLVQKIGYRSADSWFTSKLGVQWAKERGLPQGNYRLDRLPTGYHSYEKRRPGGGPKTCDRLMCGNPKGTYRTFLGFYPHFKHLQDNGSAAGCTCDVCQKTSVRRRMGATQHASPAAERSEDRAETGQPGSDLDSDDEYYSSSPARLRAAARPALSATSRLQRELVRHLSPNSLRHLREQNLISGDQVVTPPHPLPQPVARDPFSGEALAFGPTTPGFATQPSGPAVVVLPDPASQPFTRNLFSKETLAFAPAPPKFAPQLFRPAQDIYSRALPWSDRTSTLPLPPPPPPPPRLLGQNSHAPSRFGTAAPERDSDEFDGVHRLLYEEGQWEMCAEAVLGTSAATSTRPSTRDTETEQGMGKDDGWMELD